MKSHTKIHVSHRIHHDLLRFFIGFALQPQQFQFKFILLMSKRYFTFLKSGTIAIIDFCFEKPTFAPWPTRVFLEHDFFFTFCSSFSVLPNLFRGFMSLFLRIEKLNSTSSYSSHRTGNCSWIRVEEKHFTFIFAWKLNFLKKWRWKRIEEPMSLWFKSNANFDSISIDSKSIHRPKLQLQTGNSILS